MTRTHSQLKQFVKEIQKTAFSNIREKDKEFLMGEIGDLKVVTLGSRKNLCVNPSVKKLQNVNEINFECLRRQEKKDCKCAYYDRDKILDLSREIYVKRNS